MNTSGLIRDQHESEMLISDDTFLAEFKACRWPIDQWHHQQHIKLAYHYLRRYPFEEAINQIRDRIKAHNAAHNVPELPKSGYLETMTEA